VTSPKADQSVIKTPFVGIFEENEENSSKTQTTRKGKKKDIQVRRIA
jgi:hypothetical protein